MLVLIGYNIYQQKMVGIELFSGAGGMSVGASLAGIVTKAAVEIDPFAAQTFAHNHKTAKVLNIDIRKTFKKDFPNISGDKILFGGPPCQGFSKSNLKTRNTLNNNNWLYKEYIRIVKLLKPEWIVLENVYGIIGTESGFFIKQILEELNLLGYSVNYSVLNSKDYGVPQNRERVFIVGNLDKVKFKFPKPNTSKHITVSDALADLPNLENGEMGGWKPYKTEDHSIYAKQLRLDLTESPNHNVSTNTQKVLNRYIHIPQGGNWKNIPNDLMVDTYKDHSRCHTGIYHRLDENKPSIVIGNYRKNMLIHPVENRGLSVREAARLQSFPDSFEFIGNLGNQQQQVGNAVPPLLAKAVFESIVNS